MSSLDYSRFANIGDSDDSSDDEGMTIKSSSAQPPHQALPADLSKRLQEMADVNTTTSVPGMPDKLSEGAYRSIQVLMEILEDERTDPAMMRVKAMVAQDLLGRAGYGPVKQIDVRQQHISTHLTKEDIIEMRNIALAEEAKMKIQENKNYA